MLLKLLAYSGGAIVLATLFLVLAVVVAVDLAFIGLIDGLALVHVLSPALDALLRFVSLVGEAMPSERQSFEQATVQVLYLR